MPATFTDQGLIDLRTALGHAPSRMITPEIARVVYGEDPQQAAERDAFVARVEEAVGQVIEHDRPWTRQEVAVAEGYVTQAQGVVSQATIDHARFFLGLEQ